MKLKLVHNALAVPKLANGAEPPREPRYLRIMFPDSMPKQELREWADGFLPIFGEVSVDENPLVFYLSQFKMPLSVVTEQFTVFQEAGDLSWEYAG